MNRAGRTRIKMRGAVALSCCTILSALGSSAISAEKPAMVASDELGRLEIYGNPSVETLRTIISRYERSRHVSAFNNPDRGAPSPLAMAHGGGPSISPTPRIGAGPGHSSTSSPLPQAYSSNQNFDGSIPLKDERERYMNDLQRRIKRAWFPPKGNEFNAVELSFKIHRGGEMSELKMSHSSGAAIFDQTALKAVENAAPYRPLPAHLNDDITVQMTFNIHSPNSVQGSYSAF